MSARIPLHRRDGSIRAHAVVDAADFEWASRRHWSLNAYGYVVTKNPALCRAEGVQAVQLARLLLGLKRGNPRQADHINGNPLDNRRSNLRVVTNAENGQNRHYGYGSSPHRGVSWDKREQRWRAQVRLGGKKHFLGYFDAEQDAADAAAAFRAAHMPYSAEGPGLSRLDADGGALEDGEETRQHG